MKYWFIILFFLTSCGKQHTLVKDGDVYLYQGKENIIVGFISQNDEILDTTAEMIAHLQNFAPKTDESFLIEGLTDDPFFNFYMIADNLFFINDFYQNKTLIYAYVSSLYVEFAKKHPHTKSFIPLSEFDSFAKDKSPKDIENLLKSAVEFAVEDIFYVSTLELLERPQRYFFPQKTKEELFRVLIYPELVSYWNYLQFRFGTNLLLKTAQKPYDDQEWQVVFGEDVGTLEANFVNHIKNFTLPQIDYTAFTNSLQLYMSGTKKTLMTD